MALVSKWFDLCTAPLLVFALTLLIYSIFSWDRLDKQSADPHFIYLAQSFLEGQLELIKPPPHGNDWASYNVYTLKSGEVVKGIYLNKKDKKFKTLDGHIMILENREIDWKKKDKKVFVSFPPGPALLMIPLIWVQGWDSNDVLFTIFVGAFSAALFFLLLVRLKKRGIISLTKSELYWITALFSVGSTHLWCSVLGQVWFTALVVGVCCTLLYIHSSINLKHPILAGFFLALAFATRTPLLFSSIFFFILVLFPEGKLIAFNKEKLWWAAKKILLFSSVPLIVGIGLLWMNEIRFKDPLEFGHTYLQTGGIHRIQKYGLFNYHFLSKNLAAAFVLLPRLQLSTPYIIVSKHGMSIFASMPVLFALFIGRYRHSYKKSQSEHNQQLIFWRKLMMVTIVCVAIPGLFYQNTGWEQFGYRFSMDYLVYLVLLLAIGRTKLSVGFKVLILLGVIVNAFGAVTFKRNSDFYDDWFFDPDR